MPARSTRRKTPPNDQATVPATDYPDQPPLATPSDADAPQPDPPTAQALGDVVATPPADEPTLPGSPASGPTPGAPDPDAPAKPAKPRAKGRGRADRAKAKAKPKTRSVLLPVLVVDETLLLPHMSIPFPIEDEESAMVVDRAGRMAPRHVLVLTERPVATAAGESRPIPAEEDGELRGLLADAIARAADQAADAAERAEVAERPNAPATEHAAPEGAAAADPPGEAGAGSAAQPTEATEPTGAAQSTEAPEEWVPDGEGDGQEYELCGVGVIAEVGQRIARPGGHAHVILQGLARGVVTELIQQEPYLVARVTRQDDPVDATTEAEAAMTAVLEQVESYISMLPNVPEEVLTMIRGVDEPGWLADLIAFSPEFSPEQRQELLEVLDPVDRLRRLSVIVQKRLNVLNLRQQIQTEAQAGMDKQQREYYLREQLRAIQKELGEGGGEAAVATDLREKIEAAGMPEEVRAKAMVQLERLEQQHPFSPEIGVIRGYLEWLIELPWSIETEDRLDLAAAAEVLEADHYGLDKVKERIIEFIAVRKLAGDKLRAPILCFVGPPGVGKTSLGRSIARAIGRNYVRMSLGGVRDEAEIRGHRRTYVGAMPGRVIKALRDAKSRNPVVVLDEIDKVGSDAFRGDPSSALLEVLDPEQNTTFSDHYLEVPFDLSKVIFITTANLLEPIPPALRDRMEVIEVTGYTEVEKLAIARQFLLPKALEAHGLTPDQLLVSDDALRRLIREYTEESGVRNLEREIGALCRKVARRLASDDPPEQIEVDAPQVGDFLGVPRYEFGLAEEQDEAGVATGAAVTSVGGDLLSIETIVMEGKGDLVLTGQLGDVMQESARAALSYARSRAAVYGLEPGYFDRRNIHVHIPAGAIPKDGPSAGITMATALVSALTGRKVRKDVAMTGEITLRGKVLPVGGLREKTVAAHRGGIKTFILPRRNAKDLAELPAVVREGMDLIQVDTLDQVLDIALLPAEGAAAEERARSLQVA